MRTLLLVFLFALGNNICFSQTSVSINDKRNIYDEKGDYYFSKREFKKSIVYYNMAYQNDAKNYYSVLRKAEAYSALDLYDQAAACYKIVFATDLFIPNEYRLQYANLLLKNKDIRGFEKWMAKYNEIVNNEISGFITSTETRAKMYKDSSYVIVENEGVLNTPESEICPVVYKDKLVFSSDRRNLSGSKANSFYNVFAVNYLSSGQLGKLNVYNKNLNSDLSESALFLSESANKMYFTRSKSTRSNLKTFVSNIPSASNSTLDLNEVKIDGFTSIGQPAFNSKGTVMYFVSETSGGSGGLDIYSSEWIGGKWSKPKNLGSKINSNKDDMYPHIVHDSILYFTSSRTGGEGGLDLYSVNIFKSGSTPKNLGSKVNSKYDEYSLSFSSEGLTGYFCSNRPGGFGREDIYRLQLMDLKVKYAAYKHKKRTFMEDGKINLYLSDGKEYNIASKDNTGFNFEFQAEEDYKLVIQHENSSSNNTINNTKLTPAQKEKGMLFPRPIEKTEIKLRAGMKYEFTAGMKPLSNAYKTALNDLSNQYPGAAGSTIDLTALAKELLLRDGEIYTIRFVKDETQYSDYKSKGESSLLINNEAVSIGGRSFFFVLPLDNQVNFNIKTDIAYFKENFNPKKVGAVKVDAEPVFKEKVAKEISGFPILVNAESYRETASIKKIAASELTIIPGTLYVLTLTKIDPKSGREQEIVVPLTKGVQYNLGSEAQSQSSYNKALSQMRASSSSSNANEELIDISVLSKELNILSEKNIVFNLMPAANINGEVSSNRNVLTTLKVDGRRYFVSNKQKMQINLTLDLNKKVNIQTDLSYIKENFDASTIAIKVDTSSFDSDLITDPVYDVVTVNFDLNEYSIRSDAKAIIETKVVKELKSDSRLYVTIKGYTDGLGDAKHNEQLSKDRAHAVKSFLASQGIGENRIRTFSFGESLSLKKGVRWEDLSEAELQKHRKVEIVMYLPEK